MMFRSKSVPLSWNQKKTELGLLKVSVCQRPFSPVDLQFNIKQTAT